MFRVFHRSQSVSETPELILSKTQNTTPTQESTAYPDPAMAQMEAVAMKMLGKTDPSVHAMPLKQYMVLCLCLCLVLWYDGVLLFRFRKLAEVE